MGTAAGGAEGLRPWALWFLGKPASAKALLLAPRARAEDPGTSLPTLPGACLPLNLHGGSRSYIRALGVYRRRQGPERSWNHPALSASFLPAPVTKWH